MVKKGGSLRSMIGMVGLTEGSSDLNVIDAWISKLEKCESEDVTSSSHCLSPAYKGADCDPTAGGSSGGVKTEEPAKDEAKRKSLPRTQRRKPKRKSLPRTKPKRKRRRFGRQETPAKRRKPKRQEAAKEVAMTREE